MPVHRPGGACRAGGIGNQDLQARAVADLGITAYTGLPSYLRALIERYDAVLPRDGWRLTKALVTAEPLPDSSGRCCANGSRPCSWPMARPTRADRLRDHAGSACYRRPMSGGDLRSRHRCTHRHGEGEVVVTLLRADYLLVRFGTGDLSAWTTDPDGQAASSACSDGSGRQSRSGHVPPPAPGRGGARRHPRGRRLASSDPERIDHRDELSCEIVAPSGGTAHRGGQGTDPGRTAVRRARPPRRRDH